MDEKLYATRHIIGQGEFYTRHVMAMTAEGLHDKSSIAAELAHRDQRIAELEREAALSRDMVVNAENLALKVQADYYRAMERVVKLEDALRPFAENGMAVSAIARSNARALLTQEEGG
tara:strand:+ start:40961 stop:41314 length:354 start_codon:yes stop_codon:yes gene_type:complete